MDMDEDEIKRVLTEIVEAWIAQGSAGAVVADSDPAVSDVVAMLLTTGYLRGDEVAAVSPTTEALNLTDPFLCEELASAFRWEFHRRYLAYRLGEV